MARRGQGKSKEQVIKLDDGSLVRFEQPSTRHGVAVWVLADVLQNGGVI
jgi:hypothetical protein